MTAKVGVRSRRLDTRQEIEPAETGFEVGFSELIDNLHVVGIGDRRGTWRTVATRESVIECASPLRHRTGQGASGFRPSFLDAS